jgi:ubiquinone/menaquinone biosynthesis C-methylase UbiE
MTQAYKRAYSEVVSALSKGGKCLDCGASQGQHFEHLEKMVQLEKEGYWGIEWDEESVRAAQDKGINIIRDDLNSFLPFKDNTFQCVFALSVLEHLLRGCRWIQECKRVLKPGGRVVILTPNISTYFTIVLLVLGRMPSSGPHLDSALLMRTEAPLGMNQVGNPGVENDMPFDRHLVVFSYKVLRRYLCLVGFNEVRGYGFGLYPFPNFLQSLFEKIDPYHCHQMVIVATK